eukprot:GHVR01107208.1.p2 GENE.GHVR01107208.1~~GHVR01107208.1.p2  ORF type:complete len:109 (-),score=13.92 GHVR01107208.1:648-974(-)
MTRNMLQHEVTYNAYAECSASKSHHTRVIDYPQRMRVIKYSPYKYNIYEDKIHTHIYMCESMNQFLKTLLMITRIQVRKKKILIHNIHSPVIYMLKTYQFVRVCIHMY